MDYQAVTGPQWADEAHTGILCQVQFKAFDAPVPFLAMPDDPHGHGREIHDDCAAGKYGPVGDYAPAPLTPDQQYDAAMASGLTLAGSSTPAVDGTWDVSAAGARAIREEAQFISLYGAFSTGEPALPWPDLHGQLHVFPDTVTFMAFAKTVMQYVSACRQAHAALAAGQQAVFPSSAASL